MTKTTSTAALLLALNFGCGISTLHEPDAPAPPPDSVFRTDVTSEVDSGVAEASVEAPPCEEGLVSDGSWCVGWKSIPSPESCIQGESALVSFPCYSGYCHAVACDGELSQVFGSDEERWERLNRVSLTVALPPEAPRQLPEGVLNAESVLAVAQLPDGTRVALAGSLYAHPPFSTWLAAPDSDVWRRSIDAPWANPTGAWALSTDSALFLGVDGFDSFVFIRKPR